MAISKEHHRLLKNETDVLSVSESIRELLEWGRGGFNSDSFKQSTAVGKDEIKAAILAEENGFGELLNLSDSLVSKMNVDDEGELRTMLDSLMVRESAPELSTKGKIDPPEVIKGVLAGKYNSVIQGKRNLLFIIALYTYLRSTQDSKRSMTDVLSGFIEEYDDPKDSQYEERLYGLSAAPKLAEMCKIAIAKLKLGGELRKVFEEVLSTKPTSGTVSVKHNNVSLVLPKDDEVEEIRSGVRYRASDSIAPLA